MKWYDHLDFLSVEPRLFIKGKNRYVTSIGISLSILSMSILIVISIFFLYFFLDNEDINVLFVNGIDETQKVMDFEQKPFYFRLIESGERAIDPRLASVSLWYFYIGGAATKRVPLETEPCSLEKHISGEMRPRIRNSLGSRNFSSYLCVKPQIYNLNMSAANSSSYGYFNLYVSECTNSTSNNNSCLPRDEIKKQLLSKNLYLDFYSPSISVDHYNSTNPFTNIINGKLMKLYPDMFYWYNYYYKYTTYESDEGIVFRSKKNWYDFKFDITQKEILPALTGTTYVPNTFTLIQIQIDRSGYDAYKRSYPKLQQVFANIGGFAKIVFTISSFICKFISSKFYFSELSCRFIKEEEKVNKKQIKTSSSKSIMTQRSLVSKPDIISENPKNDFLSENETKIDAKLESYKIEKVPSNSTSRLGTNLENKARTINKSNGYLEVVLPLRKGRNSTSKFSSGIYSEIIKFYMSSEYLLKTYKDFSNLRELLFDERQNLLLNNMTEKTCMQHSSELKRCDKLKEVEEAYKGLDEKDREKFKGKIILN
jgi:hypothetical protein